MVRIRKNCLPTDDPGLSVIPQVPDLLFDQSGHSCSLADSGEMDREDTTGKPAWEADSSSTMLLKVTTCSAISPVSR